MRNAMMRNDMSLVSLTQGAQLRVAPRHHSCAIVQCVSPSLAHSGNLPVCPPLPVLDAPLPAASALCVSLLLGVLFLCGLSYWLSCSSRDSAGDCPRPTALLLYIGQSVPSCPQIGCVGTLGLPKGSSLMSYRCFPSLVFTCFWFFLCDTEDTKVHGEPRAQLWVAHLMNP